MKQTTTLAILITFSIGFIFRLFVREFTFQDDIVSEIASLIGSAIGYSIVILFIPFIVCFIIWIKNKSFPENTFKNLTYIILFISTVIIFIGQYNINAHSKNQIEDLREVLKKQCKEVTRNSIEVLSSERNSEKIAASEKYCNCLYDKVTNDDIGRLIKGNLKLPELINLEYKQTQEDCYKINFDSSFSGEQPFSNDLEKLNFWSSRISSYYLMTNNNFNGNLVVKMSDCLFYYLNDNHLKDINDWEERNTTATELFVHYPKLKKATEECFSNIK